MLSAVAGPLLASAAFIGTGSLTPGITHFSAGKYDESGEVTSTIAADAYSELEFGLKLDLDNNVQTGDVLSFRVYSNGLPLDNYAITPSITIAAHLMQSTAAFIGVGNLTADATIVSGAVTAWQGSAAFIGVGTMATTATMLLRPIATFAGVGSFAANNPTLQLVSNALFQGVGTLSGTPKLTMVTQSPHLVDLVH